MDKNKQEITPTTATTTSTISITAATVENSSGSVSVVNVRTATFSASLTPSPDPSNKPEEESTSQISSSYGEYEEDAIASPAEAAALASAAEVDNDDDEEEAAERGNHARHLPDSEVDFIKRVLFGRDQMKAKFSNRTLSCDQSNALQQQRFQQGSRPRKRTSAPSQFNRTNSTRNILILRSRRSWPVAPQRMRR